METILGLIPARGGSKGIPHKNIYPVAGKPLLYYTCKAALQSRSLARTILSTDSEEIAAAGRKFGVEVPFLRPQDISGDTSPSIDTVIHTLDKLAELYDFYPDAVMLLQPTSPLRQTRHIDEAIQKFIIEKADTVVSVVPVPHCYNPYSVMKCEAGLLTDFIEPEGSFDRYRRQELPKLFARNGPAVLITRTSVLKNSQSFYGERVLPYEMDEKDSIDIDNLFDVKIAEFLLRSLNGEK